MVTLTLGSVRKPNRRPDAITPADQISAIRRYAARFAAQGWTPEQLRQADQVTASLGLDTPIMGQLAEALRCAGLTVLAQPPGGF